MTKPPLFEPDELEQHLRSELRNFAPEAPDQLWTGIEARIKRPQRRRPVLLWWLFGVVTASLLTGMAYHFAGEKPIVTDKMVEVALPIAMFSASLIDANASIISTGPVATQSNSLPLKAAEYDVKSITDFPTQGQVSVSGVLPIIMHRENVASLGSQTTATLTALPIVTFLPGAALSTLEQEKKSNLTFFTQAPRIEPVRDRRWEFSAAAGPVWQWQQAVTGAPGHTNHLAFVEQSEGPATGWQAGLSTRFTLRSRWKLNAGLSQKTTTQVSSHTAELRLMDGVCLNPYDPGPKVYEFQYALHSSGNESNLTVRIAQVDTMTTMPTDEPFLLTMRTSRQRTDWVLPLTVQRMFGRGRLQGFVEGGGTMNVPGSIGVQVEHFSEACAELCFEANHMPTLTSQEHGDVSISWVLGAGIDYRLGRQWSLSASPTLFGQKGQIGLLFNIGITLRF